MRRAEYIEMNSEEMVGDGRGDKEEAVVAFEGLECCGRGEGAGGMGRD